MPLETPFLLPGTSISLLLHFVFSLLIPTVYCLTIKVSSTQSMPLLGPLIHRQLRSFFRGPSPPNSFSPMLRALAQIYFLARCLDHFSPPIASSPGSYIHFQFRYSDHLLQIHSSFHFKSVDHQFDATILT